MNLLQSVDYNQIISLDEPLPAPVCQELYAKMPVFLEIREFLIKHHLSSKEGDELDDGEQTAIKPRRKTDKYSLEETLPTHSLRDILNSLLEENRYQEGTRFLTTLGYPNVIQNHQVMNHLLGIFKHTEVIEQELRQRSAYLLQNIHKRQMGDYNQLWRIDDERRRVICESQRSVLMYLGSTGIQFMRLWFDERFREQPGDIWGYIKELTKGEKAKGLECQMLENRMALANLLLEQMAMDLAHSMCRKRPWRSMFMRAVSEGMHRDTIERVSRPKSLFDFIDRQLDLYMENSANQRLLELLFDMVAVTTNCGLVSEDSMLAYLAELYDEDQMKPDRFCQFLGLISSDTLVLGVIDYMFKTGARFVNKNTKLVAARHSITKTVFCIRSVRPMSKREDPEDWWAVVCLLSRLVQRAIMAYVGRTAQVNQTRMVPKRMHTRSGALEVSEFVQLENSRAGGEMREAAGELQTYLEGKFPLGVSDMDDGEREIIGMIHEQIELMALFLSF